MTIFIKPAAADEIMRAYEWYQSIIDELEKSFENEMSVLFRRMEKFPRAYPEVYKTFRKARLRKFPYYVFYRVESDRIVIFLLVHTSRSPRWIKRTLRSRS